MFYISEVIVAMWLSMCVYVLKCSWVIILLLYLFKLLMDFKWHFQFKK